MYIIYIYIYLIDSSIVWLTQLWLWAEIYPWQVLWQKHVNLCFCVVFDGVNGSGIYLFRTSSVPASVSPPVPHHFRRPSVPTLYPFLFRASSLALPYLLRTSPCSESLPCLCPALPVSPPYFVRACSVPVPSLFRILFEPPSHVFRISSVHVPYLVRTCSVTFPCLSLACSVPPRHLF